VQLIVVIIVITLLPLQPALAYWVRLGKLRHSRQLLFFHQLVEVPRQ